MSRSDDDLKDVVRSLRELVSQNKSRGSVNEVVSIYSDAGTLRQNMQRLFELVLIGGDGSPALLSQIVELREKMNSFTGDVATLTSGIQALSNKLDSMKKEDREYKHAFRIAVISSVVGPILVAVVIGLVQYFGKG